MHSKSPVIKLFEHQLNTTLQSFPYSSDFVNSIKSPDTEIIVNFPVKLESGEVQVFQGFRVQHNNLLGPYKGGLRFAENLYLDECKALAFWMTIKTALHNLPLGGGKGGIKFDPRKFSSEDCRRIIQAYGKKLNRFIGPMTDIPAPDVGSTSQHMDWLTAQYQKQSHNLIYSCFTGKSLSFRGSQGRTHATGLGVFATIKYWFNNYFFESIQKKTYIIQGFGNVGANTYCYLQKNGAVCLALADHTGYFAIDPNYDISNNWESICGYNKEYGSLDGIDKKYDTIKRINQDTFWKIQCDVVIPAALELQITKSIAENLNCKLIAEAANGAITIEGEECLIKKNIEIIPDVLCNSGGVVVSYFEWLQNRSNDYWPLELVDQKMLDIMNKSCDQVLQIKKDNKIKATNDVTHNSNRTLVYYQALYNLATVFEIKR